MDSKRYSSQARVNGKTVGLVGFSRNAGLFKFDLLSYAWVKVCFMKARLNFIAGARCIDQMIMLVNIQG